MGLPCGWTAATKKSAPSPDGSIGAAGGGGGGGGNGVDHNRDGLHEHEKRRQPPPPPFPDMIVEALHALSNSRGSSQLATVNWLKASRYGWIAAQDEVNFKARVAAGIRQVRRHALARGNG